MKIINSELNFQEIYQPLFLHKILILQEFCYLNQNYFNNNL
jgi:hypothetical protein